MSDSKEKSNETVPGSFPRGFQNWFTGNIRRLKSLISGRSALPRRSEKSLEINFPRDLYAHPEAETEWWYYTGHCTTISGREFCFELVFFKRQTDRDYLGLLPLKILANPMYAAHFAITDIDRRRFRFDDRKCFIPLFDQPAAASQTELKLKIGDWEIHESDNAHRLRADLGEDLIFEAILENTKPVALNGHRKPLQNIPGNDETSSHFSYTRMKLEGEIIEKGHREAFYGQGWMDREFGTWYQRNWDWFSIQFEDRTELMLYHFRNDENEPVRVSHGTFIEKDGTCTYLKNEDFQITPLKNWKSPQTGTVYPAQWHIRVKSPEVEVEIIPYLENQELDTRQTTMIVYWEGACRVGGRKDGKDIRGSAYVELVGYDGSNEKPTLGNFLSGFLSK
jgi:predicted secreted hydrolase